MNFFWRGLFRRSVCWWHETVIFSMPRCAFHFDTSCQSSQWGDGKGSFQLTGIEQVKFIVYIWQLIFVSVSLSCCNKLPETRWLKTINTYCLTVLWIQGPEILRLNWSPGLKISRAEKKVPAAFLSKCCGEEATSKVTQVVGQSQCLVILRLNPCLFTGCEMRALPSF